MSRDDLLDVVSKWERWLAPVGLVTALAFLIGTSWITYRNVQRAAESADWVSQSRQVLAVTHGIRAELSQAESAGRGFLLSDDEIYREQFDRAIAAAVQQQSKLKQLTLDNPEQKKRVGSLSDLIEPKIQLMQQFVLSHTNPDPDSIAAAAVLRLGTQQMTDIRELVREIEQAEDELLTQRSDMLKHRLTITRISLLLSTLLASSLVLGTYYLLRRHWRLKTSSADMSRRHVREKDELARYNQRLLESTGEGIYGIDTDGICTFMNRAGALILGGNPSDFLGKDMHELVHHTTSDGDPYPVTDCPIYKSSRSGDGCRVDDELFWRLDGKSVPVEYSSFPLKNKDVVEGAVITFNDITSRLRSRQELERAKESAEAANESKSQFLANMSHELRTPLNAVIMYSELLAEEAEDQQVPEFIPDLKRIRSAGKHLLELVNGVLDLSKVEAGKMELFPESFEVADVIDEVVATVEALVEKNDNRLQVDIDQDVATMVGDVVKLRQVLYNLLSNASKFTENGLIRLHISRDADNKMVRFAVSDTGIGMTSEQLAQLFQPFVQVDASTTRKYGGTGLGLAIIKRFTELMCGSVDVSSVQGEGTTFTVLLPENLDKVDVAKAAEQRDEAAAVSEAVTTRQSTPLAEGASVVLVIDDDPAIRDILTRVLVAEGIRPVTAADGAEGLVRAKQCHPDLIILDVMMPKVDGWSVLASLKADNELADIPVIMQSVKDDHDLGFMLGASEYLVKPIDRQKLVSMLRRYMQDDPSYVLLVEDDDTTRRAVARTLEDQGWRVIQAGNGREALDCVRGETPAVVLLDLMMPEMDGFEFLEVVRADPQWISIPVVVLTAMELTSEDHARLNGSVERILAKGSLSRRKLLDEVRHLVTNLARRPHKTAVETESAQEKEKQQPTAQ
ncbi:response regulator [Novipirellula caenicola]|uniref:histidine kinase n=1 Tax=Novipirellula caenicola TaxID=1536901 RepID=A0ABP9VKY3_9BACT